MKNFVKLLFIAIIVLTFALDATQFASAQTDGEIVVVTNIDKIKKLPREMKTIVGQIKRREKTLAEISSDTPAKIVDRHKEDLERLITQFNFYCEAIGSKERYKSPVLAELETKSNDVEFVQANSTGEVDLRSNNSFEEATVLITDSATQAIPQVNSRPEREVTLIATSDGPTKDDAIKNALRNAIEQAFGTFVSANTTILNDELVKDEIVTVTNGSIKNYNEIASAKVANGYTVTLEATVCIGKLIKYAKNHGSECEFAGQTFGMEMKLFELQKQNELKALENLYNQIIAMLPMYMEYKLIVDEPKIPKEIQFRKKMASGGGIYKKADKYFFSAFKSNMDKSYTLIREQDVYLGALRLFSRFGISDIFCYDDELQNRLDSLEKNLVSGFYCVPMQIIFEPAQEGQSPIYDVFCKTLQSLSLSQNEIESLKKKNIQTTEIESNYGHAKYNLRNSSEDVKAWIYKLWDGIRREFNKFEIIDNLGITSFFYPEDMIERIIRADYSNDYKPYDIDENKLNITGDKSPVVMCDYITALDGDGIFKDLFTATLENGMSYKEISEYCEFRGCFITTVKNPHQKCLC